jgi:predicted Zn-dependent peptidase
MIEYREKYYRPDNATLVLAGDLDPDKVMALVTKYFGAIKSKGKSPRVRTEEPSPEFYRRTVSPNFKPPYIEKRVIGRAAANPSVALMFHIPPLWHDDLPALYMLGRAMSARTGKMYMDLVEKQQHVTGVSASASNSMYDGAFRVSATGREVRGELAVPLDQIEKELWAYLEEAKTVAVDAPLLQRIKNSVEAQYLQGLAGTGIAGSLARMEVAYRWQHLEDEFKARMAITPADMMRVAKKYFTRDNCVTGVLERER